ncbi:hypothetical protein DL98DRAFT_637252 [Cadophora sp. DSE1049]|nr:hypothetical protein DL98DRAFT_637252 [Cadophora sp. DSE1049]
MKQIGKTKLPKWQTYRNATLTIAATKSSDSSGGIYSEFPHLPHDDRSSWPLLHRAWIYQERLFSRRVLHFGEEEVIWECKTLRRGQNRKKDKHIELEKDFLSMSTSWYEYVQMYSILQLTFDTDKLVALSSLAVRTALARPGDRYIAGHWEKTLLRDIMWYADHESVQPRSSTFCCPTWSWASIKSGVIFESGWEMPCISGVSVVDISCPAD